MLEEILGHIHNYFDKSRIRGKFTISSGTLSIPGIQDGQYLRVVGSVFNDGIHQYPNSSFVDEEFEGEIWLLAIPPRVITLAGEIKQWCDNHPTSEYTSESWGGYSYTVGTNPNTGAPISWQNVFRGRLNEWRKIS